MASPRSGRGAVSPNLKAGELESELRRALRRAQKPSPSEPQKPAFDPIFMAQELRPQPSASLPMVGQRSAPAKPRGSAMRNILAISLSAAVVGVAIQQIGQQWGTSGGGGGGGSGGGARTEPAARSVGTAIKPKDQSKPVQTGYSIQPLIQPGKPTELEAVDLDEPVIKGDEGSANGDVSASDVAAAGFQLDVEEATKLFHKKESAAVPPVTPIAASASPKSTPLSSAEENSLMRRAKALMQTGDITGARLLFEHLANRDSALGAFALAQSFDRDVLEKMYVRGLAPDQKQADRWYRRAAELSSRDALNPSSKAGR